MKMKVERNKIYIIPENEIDVAYIEEVLGMKRKGDHCVEGDQCVGDRVDVMGTSALAYISIRRAEVKE